MLRLRTAALPEEPDSTSNSIFYLHSCAPDSLAYPCYSPPIPPAAQPKGLNSLGVRQGYIFAAPQGRSSSFPAHAAPGSHNRRSHVACRTALKPSRESMEARCGVAHVVVLQSLDSWMRSSALQLIRRRVRSSSCLPRRSYPRADLHCTLPQRPEIHEA